MIFYKKNDIVHERAMKASPPSCCQEAKETKMAESFAIPLDERILFQIFLTDLLDQMYQNIGRILEQPKIHRILSNMFYSQNNLENRWVLPRVRTMTLIQYQQLKVDPFSLQNLIVYKCMMCITSLYIIIMVIFCNLQLCICILWFYIQVDLENQGSGP